MKLHLILLSILVIFTSCLQKSTAESSLIEIDTTKSYPEKEINLKDICDITYIKFQSDKDEFLFTGPPVYISNNTVIVHDHGYGSFYFFTQKGEFKSRFNHRGNGPEEYHHIRGITYDEKKDELFVGVMNGILVYNSIGEYKRKLSLPNTMLQELTNFDEHSLLFFNLRKRADLNLAILDQIQINIDKTPSNFVRISKSDGELIEYVPVPEDYSFFIAGENKVTKQKISQRQTNIVRNKNGFLLSNKETDTIFYYGKESVLTPVWVHTPSIKTMHTFSYINGFIEGEEYDFFERFDLKDLESPTLLTFLMRNKKTNSIYTQKIVFDDYKDYFISIAPNILQSLNSLPNTGAFFLNTGDLIEAYEDNRLSGELKELVADMNEEDNGILMLLHFK